MELEITGAHRLPKHIADIPEMEALRLVVDDFVGEYAEAYDSADNNLFVETADEYGIARREKILGIEAVGTLEDRWELVRILWITPWMYTMKYLTAVLDDIAGDDYTMTVTDTTVTIRIFLDSKLKIEMIKKLIESAVPLHIVLDIDLMYNSWSMFADGTWGDLAEETWSHWKEDVIE